MHGLAQVRMEIHCHYVAGVSASAKGDMSMPVAAWRRSQYDELLEDEEDSAKRRGPHPAGPSQQQQQQKAQAPPPGAGAQPAGGGTPPDEGMGPLQSGQLAAQQAGAGGHASNGSPEPHPPQRQRASPPGSQRAGQAAAAAELPAMITFDEDGDDASAMAAAPGRSAGDSPNQGPTPLVFVKVSASVQRRMCRGYWVALHPTPSCAAPLAALPTTDLVHAEAVASCTQEARRLWTL